MRKGRDGEMENGKWKKLKKKNNGENSGHYVVASQPPNANRLQRRTARKANEANLDFTN